MDNCLSLTQVGIRGLRNPATLYNEMKDLGHNVVNMKQVHDLGPAGIAALIPAGEPVYISIDIDALDMSLIPGCVSGEPNGMTFNELIDSLRAIVETHPVIGFDFVEINPMLDVGTGATSYLGTVIVVTLLGIICNQPRWQEHLAARGML
jgi:agmatinase